MDILIGYGGKWLYEKIREIVNPRIPVTIEIVIEKLNMVLRGWVNYFRIGHASKWFKKVKDYVEKKVRRYIRGKRNRAGYGRMAASHRAVTKVNV